MPKVVVIGSANVDLTVKVDRLPQLGETVSGGEFYTSFGGKGANQAVAAHRAGAEVRFLAKVGCDQNGEAIVKHLEAIGLTSEAILRDESNPSGVALIMVDRTGNNAIAVAPGSNWNLTEEDVYRAESHIAWGDVLLIQLEVPPPTVRETLRLAKTHGLVTILNPAPARPLPEGTLSLADILTPNEVEAGTLTGIRVEDVNDATQAARKLLEFGAGQVIVTLGERGACWVQRDHVQTFSSFPIAAVDSTAAGDAFNGALAYVVAEERPVQEAIYFANAAGAIAVTRKGAQDSLPTREEIANLLMQSQR
ncbi:MAG: ribokinase [Deltaproteobacteria bacterium]|nr:MAG: ribokinase [Deltaproteobacteria bacterium]